MINDIRSGRVDKYIFISFLIVGIFFIVLDYDNIDINFFINTLYSVGFGILLLLFSYISKESIGKGDSLFFIISGLYLGLSDNVMLFLSGLIFASIYGGYRYFKYKIFSVKKISSIPFIPCLIPMIIWRTICLV